MLLLLVPELKSSSSTSAVTNPLLAESTAHPAPVAPPPIEESIPAYMIHFCIKRNLQCEHAGSVSVSFVGKFHYNARNNRQHFLQAEIGQQYQFALDK